MENENARNEDQPSTSKNETRPEEKDEAGNKTSTKEDKSENGSKVSRSSSWSSSQFSRRSKVSVEDITPVTQTGRMRHSRRKREKRHGRVTKKTRRPKVSRRGRRQQRKRTMRREVSIASLLTLTTSRSGAKSAACMVCGHRCCLRRKGLRSMRKWKTNMMREAATQVGASLSPLLVNVATIEQVAPPVTPYQEVTPEMIVQSLKGLSMWRQGATVYEILSFIKNNYPVNPSESELIQELAEKLRIAALVGIVTCYRERWMLSSKLQGQKELDRNHVTMFWQLYADTMSPLEIRNPVPNARPPQIQEEDKSTPFYIS